MVCTMVGCASGAIFYLPTPARLWHGATLVRACLNDDCKEVAATRAGRMVFIPGPRLNSTRTATLSVQVLGANKELLYRARAARGTYESGAQWGEVRAGVLPGPRGDQPSHEVAHHELREASAIVTFSPIFVTG